jgi:hypothetical protein
MKIVVHTLFVTCLVFIAANAAVADQWRSRVIAECYDNLIGSYSGHVFVRVFHTKLGGGQLDAPDGQAEGVFSLEQLDRTPFSCVVNGKVVRFELVDYRPTRETGACAQCQHTGFRLTVDGTVIWDAPAPESIGMPIFNGTIDLDMDMARICSAERRKSRPESDFFTNDQWALTCETIYH